MKKINKKLNLSLFSLIFLLGLVFSVQASGISEQKVIELVNQSRKKAGLKTLLENQKLDQIASLKAQDMLDNKYFAHTSPQGVTPWDWFSEVGYSYKYAGENLAIDFNSAEDQHQAWMDSATHRKNILSDKFSEIGVAVAAGKIKGDNNSLIVVQVFGEPSAWESVNEKDNFFLGKDKKVDWEEQQGIVLSSQKAGGNNLPSDNQEELIGFEKMQKNVWLFLLIISFGVLAVNPMHWLSKGYAENLSILRGKLSKKRLAFKKSLEDYEKLTRKIMVKNEDHEETKIVKIRI